MGVLFSGKLRTWFFGDIRESFWFREKFWVISIRRKIQGSEGGCRRDRRNPSGWILDQSASSEAWKVQDWAFEPVSSSLSSSGATRFGLCLLGNGWRRLILWTRAKGMEGCSSPKRDGVTRTFETAKRDDTELSALKTSRQKRSTNTAHDVRG